MTSLRSSESIESIESWRLAAYGTPAIPIIIIWFPLYLYLPAFYAESGGIDLIVLGSIFLFTRLFDGASDLIIGWWSDKTKAKFGGRKTWLFVSAPLLVVSAYYLCIPPEGSGAFHLAFWLILFYVAWTAFQIPYLAWGADLGTTPEENTRIMGFRGYGTMLGVLIALTVPKIYLGLSQLEFDAAMPWWNRVGESILWEDVSPSDLLPVFVVLVTITVVFAVCIAGKLTPGVPSRPLPDVAPQNFRSMLKIAFSDRVFVRFIVGFFLFNLGYSIGNASLYFIIEVSHGFRGQLLTFTLGAYLLALALMPFMVRFAQRIGNGRAFCLLAAALGFSLIIWLAAPRGNLALVSLGYFCYAFCEALVWVVPPALVADAADRGYRESGNHQAGVFLAMFNLLLKSGLALGPAVGFPLLVLAGFDPTLGTDNTDTALELIRLYGLGLPIVLIFGGVAVMWRYPKNSTA